MASLSLYEKHQKEMYPYQIPKQKEDMYLYTMKRCFATVGHGCGNHGMLLNPKFDEEMKYGSVMHEDEDVVTRLTQVYKEMEQVTSNSAKALSCPTYNHAKKIMRILGRTLWNKILDKMGGQMGYETMLEKLDVDETHGTFTQKTTTMRNQFESACERLKQDSRKVTCYSVFAQFLESMELGRWEGDQLRTIVVDVDEYIGSNADNIIMDSKGAELFESEVSIYSAPSM